MSLASHYRRFFRSKRHTDGMESFDGIKIQCFRRKLVEARNLEIQLGCKSVGSNDSVLDKITGGVDRTRVISPEKFLQYLLICKILLKV